MPDIDILKYRNDLKTKKEAEKVYVFDPLRRKYVVFTPEEMIRQLFIQYLLQELKIPKKHIAVERQIIINQKSYRFDILVFDRSGKPLMVVECKSHKVDITDKTALQISRYNIALKAKYLCLTNGKRSYFYKIDFDNRDLKILENIPMISIK